jgi:hypothetical protein
MTSNEEREDYGIFAIPDAFSKYQCVTRLLMWGVAACFFYLHVIIMWGRWYEPDSPMIKVCIGCGFAAIILNALSFFRINFNDPTIINKFVLKALYVALSFFSLYNFMGTGKYSFGAWLTPLVSVGATGFSGCSFIQEAHRLAIAYRKHSYCDAIKNQLIQNGRIMRVNCSMQNNKDDKYISIGATVAYIGITIACMWGFFHSYQEGVLRYFAMSLAFVLEFCAGCATIFTLKEHKESNINIVKFLFQLTAWYAGVFVLGSIIPNGYVTIIIAITCCLVGLIIRLHADIAIAPIVFGRSFGFFVFAAIPLFRLLQHYNESGYSFIYCTIVAGIQMGLMAIMIYTYYRKKEFFKIINDTFTRKRNH